jgi:hypothetical protein
MRRERDGFDLVKVDDGVPENFWKKAFVLALGLRVIYSLLAAGISLVQPVNIALMRSNALTGDLASPNHSLRYLLLGCWERFDTLWYLHIAARGYDLPASVVFFPLYPGLIRIVSYVMPPIAAALLISTAAFFLLLWGFYELLRGEMPGAQAERSVKLMAVWPASFIFLAGYAECLLLALIVWSLVMAQRGWWKRAALLGVAAGLTKAAGALVLVPLLVMAVRRRQVSAWPVLTVPFGSLAFLGWLRQTGRVPLSLAYTQYWHTSVAMPWQTLGGAFIVFSQTHSALLAVNLFMLVACCGLVVASRMKAAYWLFATAVVFLCLTKMTDPPLQSMLRYALIVFPVYVGLARCLDHRWLSERLGLVCTALFAVNLGLLWLFLGWSLVL